MKGLKKLPSLFQENTGDMFYLVGKINQKEEFMGFRK